MGPDKRLNPAAKLVCLDIQPYQTTQAQSRNDVLNIGGFSDAVFEVIAAFADGESGPETAAKDRSRRASMKECSRRVSRCGQLQRMPVETTDRYSPVAGSNPAGFSFLMDP